MAESKFDQSEHQPVFCLLIMSLQSQKGNSQREQLTGINYLVPNAICKLLASGAILVNLYWSKSHEVQLVGMGVATLFSFAFGYLIIISLNLGLAYEIGRKRDCPRDIGIYYQRALVINFITCAFLITPLFYISKKIVVLFVHIDTSLAVVIGEYLFQLVPSIFAFAFYDTTQTYLLAQGHFLPPLVINIFGFFLHFYLIQHLGAAWSKNAMDVGRCLAIYISLVARRRKLQSWIEWTILCFKGWENHLRYYNNIGLTTYTHALFFFVFAMVGYSIPRSELICHICFINIAQMIFIVNVGLKEGLIVRMSDCIRRRKIQYTRSIGLRSLRIFFFLSLLFLFFMFMYVHEICDFFFSSQPAKDIFGAKYWLLFLSITSDSLAISLGTMVKVFNRRHSLLRYQIGFFLLSTALAYFFCYRLEAGLSGLWYGWILGSLFSAGFNWAMLLRYQVAYAPARNKETLLRHKQEYDQDQF